MYHLRSGVEGPAAPSAWAEPYKCTMVGMVAVSRERGEESSGELGPPLMREGVSHGSGRRAGIGRTPDADGERLGVAIPPQDVRLVGGGRHT